MLSRVYSLKYSLLHMYANEYVFIKFSNRHNFKTCFMNSWIIYLKYSQLMKNGFKTFYIILYCVVLVHNFEHYLNTWKKVK